MTKLTFSKEIIQSDNLRSVIIFQTFNTLKISIK